MSKFERLLQTAGFKDIEEQEIHDEESMISFSNELGSRYNITFDKEDKVIFFQAFHNNQVYDLHELLYNYDDELTLHTIDIDQLLNWK